MAVDKDLFLHDLAVVAIMKNEGHYIKEWLDYHLLAGVEHFYLYDNESPDNQAEVAKPYVEAGLVDYFPAPGKMMQMATYNDAINRFKFQCRYMTFLDGDEFIYPKVDRGGGITEIVDDVFSAMPNAGELSISWRIFGSNGQEKADYSRGVLERFTRREADTDNNTNGCKCIADPRKINYSKSPHNMELAEGFFSVTEKKEVKTCLPYVLEPAHIDKIVVNHYHCKSWEEYSQKAPRGDNWKLNSSKYSRKFFEERDHNEEFDDGILKYRDARAKVYQPPDKSHAAERLFAALVKNLAPMRLSDTPSSFYAGKLETFLTCRAVAAYLKTKPTYKEPAKLLEETALRAVLKSVAGMSFADGRLLISELPNLLSLPYPVVNEIRNVTLKIIPQMQNVFRLNNMWRDYVELDYLQRLLENI